MTRQTLACAAAATLLAAALGLPSAAPAAVSSAAREPVRFAMQTRFYDTYRPGDVVGQMSLTVYPSGVVSGFYIGDDDQPSDVTGGVDGQNIWLDIGGIHSLHLTGTLRNGVLKAAAVLPGPDTYLFESTKSVRQTS